MTRRTQSFLPYGRQQIDEDDIAAVVAALRSDWLTTGPRVGDFEQAFASAVGATHAVAVSSGTAGLHAAMHVLGVGPGDEVIVPAITFVATANAVRFCGATPVFADVQPDTLLIDPDSVAQRITARTKVIVAVDYAGQPCDYAELTLLARQHGLALVADACHSLGASYQGQPVGSLADLNVFSLHPVKHITTGEGGMVTTADPQLAAALRRFRNHGIDSDHRQRTQSGTWRYDMVELGYNYRITDFQCALGESQLRKLPEWIAGRRRLAADYDQRFAEIEGALPLARRDDRDHAYHLYVVRLAANRDGVFDSLRRAGIGANVHYMPVHLHSYYRGQLGTREGMCPVAESAFEHILTLPLFPAMTRPDVERVAATLALAISATRQGTERQVAP